MYWSAGDATDLLQFFNGAALVGTFNVGSIIPSLTDSYWGNPNTQENPSEPYAYVNFTGTGGTTFDKIVFTDTATTGSGFESDNHSVYNQPINPPGNVVPEPSTVIAGVLLLLPFGLQGMRFLRNRRAAAQ